MSLTVAGASAAPFEVRLPAEPKPWEKTAAGELEHYLPLCLGDNPLTVEGMDGVVFHVGDTEFARGKLAPTGGAGGSPAANMRFRALLSLLGEWRLGDGERHLYFHFCQL